ncbi:MAG: putative toxin-antitoxin system toxin component, PIN family [Chloroflexota bacterium]|nr:putative toxin-antitoxin system toxin component, PIN family [Chloroflexota bacterium]
MRPSAVIDSNVFVSAVLSSRGAPFQIVEWFREGRIRLYMSDGQLNELYDVLARPFLTQKLNIPRERITDLLELLEEMTERVDPLDPLPVPVRDPKDEVILGAAIAGDADFLVTGDNDLRVLADDPRLGRLQIVTARKFLDIFEPT